MNSDHTEAINNSQKGRKGEINFYKGDIRFYYYYSRYAS